MNFIFSLIFCLAIFVVTYIPYIIFIGIFAMIVWIIITKKIASKILKTLIIIVILLYSTIIIGGFKKETPDNLYTEMKEKYDSQRFIGLSKEEIVELLGKPNEYDKEESQYVYFSGKVFKEWYWGKCYSTKYYQIKVFFDENDKVKSTLLEEYIPRGG